MRLPLLAAAALLAGTPALARAQLAPRAVSLESGLSTPLSARGAPTAALAVSASAWLDDLELGTLDGVLRVARASAPETPGRAAAAGLAATAGLRLSLGRAPVRPQLLAELGWSWLRAADSRGGLAFGLGAGVEWFPATDVSLSARAAIRAAGPAAAADGLVALAAYF